MFWHVVLCHDLYFWNDHHKKCDAELFDRKIDSDLLFPSGCTEGIFLPTFYGDDLCAGDDLPWQVFHGADDLGAWKAGILGSGAVPFGKLSVEEGREANRYFGGLKCEKSLYRRFFTCKFVPAAQSLQVVERCII